MDARRSTAVRSSMGGSWAGLTRLFLLALCTALAVGVGGGWSGAGAADLEEPAAGARVVREVEGDRTEGSRTFVLSDGSRKTELYPDAINYRDSNGELQPIDNTLVRQSDGALTNKANPLSIKLPKTLSGDAVKVAHAGRSVTFKLRGAKAEASVHGAEATFKDALPGVAVVFEAKRRSLKETLILASRTRQPGTRSRSSSRPG